MQVIKNKVLDEIELVKTNPEYLGPKGHQKLLKLRDQHSKLNFVV